MRSWAVVASKFEGSVFGKEQIGHTQLMLCDLAPLPSPAALLRRPLGNGDAVALRGGESPGEEPCRPCVRGCMDDLFDTFGYRVTFDEDFKKPA